MQQPRIVTWRAVSSEDQAEKESLAHQDRLNREHVSRWGGVVVASLEVPGVTRNIVLWEDACRSIEAYAQLDKLIERAAFDVLMCMDATRLGRHRALIYAMAGLCERANIRIYETSSPPSSLDGPASTSDSRLLMTLKGYMAEEEVRKLSERAMFGRAAQVRKGKHANKPPAGLRQEHDRITGEVLTVTDEAWVPLVKFFFELYLDHGRSQRAVAREFNARGLFIPGTLQQWDEHSIRVFLRNRWAYAGFVTWAASSKRVKAFRAKAEWEPIISEETARRAEEEMELRSKMPRTIGATERFSATAKCETCGANLVVSRHKARRGGERISYRCRQQCPGGMVRDYRIHEAIHDAIVALQDDVRLESILAEVPDDHPDLHQVLEEAKRALDQVAKERNNLTMAFIREAIRLDEYEGLMAQLRERHESIERNIADLEEQAAAIPTKEERFRQLNDVRSVGLTMLNHADAATANAWIRRHFRLYVSDNSITAVELL